MARSGGKGEQLELRARTWGGKRKGAGRPRLERRACEPHRRRAVVKARHPVHVVVRVSKDVGQLRRRDGYEAIRRALARVLGRHDFRIVHVSVQRTHLHLLVEAEEGGALARGMQAFLITAARALNRACKRARGTVFPQRYHATAIETPRQARAALAYVINNWRRHREDAIAWARGLATDPYASGASFDGWRSPVHTAPLGDAPLPVARSSTWLLTTGWKRHGLLDARAVPGPAVPDPMPPAR